MLWKSTDRILAIDISRVSGYYSGENNMHEMGIVYHVADEVERVAAENGIHHVRRVTLQIGQVTGVLFDYMADLWTWVADKSDVLRGSVLGYEEIHAVTRCEDCGQLYDTVPQGRQCPYCGSWRTFLVQGNEYIIKEIETDDDDFSEEDEKDAPLPSEQASGSRQPAEKGYREWRK